MVQDVVHPHMRARAVRSLNEVKQLLPRLVLPFRRTSLAQPRGSTIATCGQRNILAVWSLF